MKNYEVSQLDGMEPTPCPCGQARRAFAHSPGSVASVHVVDISRDSQTHYHRKTTEFYVVLEGDGVLEADGDTIPLKPMTAVMIRPGCRHRAVGDLRILNIPVPAFDPDDEWLD